MTHTRAHATDHGGHHDGTGQAEILDRDADVLAEHNAAIIEWLPLDTPPRQIVDLGCGTGAGTFALLARFPTAHVTAVDSSIEYLRRLQQKACDQGLDGRVRTIRTDLNEEDWPDLGTPDLVWASASMHHMSDPDRTLRKVHRMIGPGGLFAVVELAGFPRFLPDDAPVDRPGLEERCHAVSDRFHVEHVPHRGADWGPKLIRAGFTLAGTRTHAISIEGSGDEAIGRYALAGLQRIRSTVAGELSADDLAALDRLLDTGSPGGILNRNDLAVRTERAVWAARRDGDRTTLDTMLDVVEVRRGLVGNGQGATPSLISGDT